MLCFPPVPIGAYVVITRGNLNKISSPLAGLVCMTLALERGGDRSRSRRRWRQCSCARWVHSTWSFHTWAYLVYFVPSVDMALCWSAAVRRWAVDPQGGGPHSGSPREGGPADSPHKRAKEAGWETRIPWACRGKSSFLLCLSEIPVSLLAVWDYRWLVLVGDGGRGEQGAEGRQSTWGPKWRIWPQPHAQRPADTRQP